MLLIFRAVIILIKIDVKNATCIYLLLYCRVLVYPHYIKVTKHSIWKKEAHQIKQFALINLNLFHESKFITLSSSNGPFANQNPRK